MLDRRALIKLGLYGGSGALFHLTRLNSGAWGWTLDQDDRTDDEKRTTTTIIITRVAEVAVAARAVPRCRVSRPACPFRQQQPRWIPAHCPEFLSTTMESPPVIIRSSSAKHRYRYTPTCRQPWCGLLCAYAHTWRTDLPRAHV